MTTARIRLAECHAILGGARDPMRGVWEDQATYKDRKLLLAMAGCVGAEGARLADREWGKLSPETRVNIKGGLARWRAWAERLAP